MKQKMICIGIIGLFLITVLAGVVSAGTYKGVVCNVRVEGWPTGIWHATSLYGFIDEKFCTGEIQISGSILLPETCLPRLAMLYYFHRIILPMRILQGNDAIKI